VRDSRPSQKVNEQSDLRTVDLIAVESCLQLSGAVQTTVHLAHRIATCIFEYSQPINETYHRKKSMTLNTSKATADHKGEVQTVQQHHQQAGEHLQHAATRHLAAAKMHGSGDHKAADKHAKDARDHTTQAAQHVAQADKKMPREARTTRVTIAR
jgi:hypothetical protein